MNRIALTCLAALSACAPLDDLPEPEPAAAYAQAVINPAIQYGTVELGRVYGDTTNFGQSFNLGARPILPGSSSEVPVGVTYLDTRPDSFGDGTMPFQRRTLDIKDRSYYTQDISGVRIRYDRPLSLGASLVRVKILSNSSFGNFRLPGAWTQRASGTGMLLLTEDIAVYNDAGLPRTISLSAGRISEVVLPTVEIDALTRSYDARYPDVSSCGSTRLIGGTKLGRQDVRDVRNSGGVTMKSFVTAAGPYAPVVLRAFGIEFNYSTDGYTWRGIDIPRLQVDEIEVPDGKGGRVMAAGTFTLEYKRPDGTYAPMGCTGRTRNGVDLPQGTYRITVTARAPDGRYWTDVEEKTLW